MSDVGRAPSLPFWSVCIDDFWSLGYEEHRNVVVREIMTSPLLDRLLMDPYGNYVVQSTLSVTKGALHSELVDRIRPHLPLIKNSPFGKRILRLLLENKK